MLNHLEKVIMDMSDGKERIKRTREWLKSLTGAKAEEAAA